MPLVTSLPMESPVESFVASIATSDLEFDFEPFGFKQACIFAAGLHSVLAPVLWSLSSTRRGIGALSDVHRATLCHVHHASLGLGFCFDLLLQGPTLGNGFLRHL